MTLVLLAISSLLLAGPFVFFLTDLRRLSRAKPEHWIQTPTRKVGVRWLTESQEWAGLEQAILAIEHVLILRYGAEVVKKKQLLDFWIDVYPRNTLIRTGTNPTGKMLGKNVNGAVERLAFFFGLVEQHVILVMQQHRLRSKMQNGETWQEGELLDAGTSALFHEVAEHYVPLRLKNDINARHAEEWKLLTLEMQRAYKTLGAVSK